MPLAKFGTISNGYVSDANQFYHRTYQDAIAQGLSLSWLRPAARASKSLRGLSFTSQDIRELEATGLAAHRLKAEQFSSMSFREKLRISSLPCVIPRFSRNDRREIIRFVPFDGGRFGASSGGARKRSHLQRSWLPALFSFRRLTSLYCRRGKVSHPPMFQIANAHTLVESSKTGYP